MAAWSSMATASIAIREHKDLRESERDIAWCNAGLMALSGKHSLKLLDSIGTANAQGEYYLTDVVELASSMGLGARALSVAEEEVLGINDRVQLAAAEAVLQTRLRTEAMRKGVTFVDPSSVHLSFDTELGPDVTIEPNVFFGPGVRVGAGTAIRAFCHIEGAKIGEACIVGPFARLRPGTELDARRPYRQFRRGEGVALSARA